MGRRVLASEKWIGVVADLCVVISIVWGVFTYIDQKNYSEVLRRREAALQFSALRHDSAYAGASEALVTSLTKQNRLLVAQGNQSDAKKSDAEDVIEEVGAGKIDGLAMLYISALACKEKFICDSEMMNTLFKNDISFFYCATKDYILPLLTDRMGSETRYEKLKTYFDKEIKACPKKKYLI